MLAQVITDKLTAAQGSAKTCQRHEGLQQKGQSSTVLAGAEVWRPVESAASAGRFTHTQRSVCRGEGEPLGKVHSDSAEALLRKDGDGGSSGG